MKKVIIGCCYLFMAIILYIGIHIGAILYVPHLQGHFRILGKFGSALLNTGLIPFLFVIYLLKKGFSLINEQISKK